MATEQSNRKRAGALWTKAAILHAALALGDERTKAAKRMRARVRSLAAMALTLRPDVAWTHRTVPARMSSDLRREAGKGGR